jgi:hypothetical protein
LIFTYFAWFWVETQKRLDWFFSGYESSSRQMMTVVILMMMVLTTATKTKMMIGFTCHGSRSLNFTQLRSKGLFLLSLRLLGSPPKKVIGWLKIAHFETVGRYS